MSENRPAFSVAVGRPLSLPLLRQAVYGLAGRLAFPYGLPLMFAFAAVLVYFSEFYAVAIAFAVAVLIFFAFNEIQARTGERAAWNHG